MRPAVTRPCSLTWAPSSQVGIVHRCGGASLPARSRIYPLRGQGWHQLSKLLRESGAAAARPRSSWDARDTSAAVLVTGTAIGGGFLALPYTTAPSGFVPSLVVMLLSWAMLFVQAQVATDLLVDESKSKTSETSETQAVSFAVAGERRLGTKGKVVVSGLFLLLMMTTLVSQYAEAGALFSTLTGWPQPCVRALLALLLAILTWNSPTTRTAAINGCLTLGFVVASLVVFGTGLPLAQWHRLARTDWHSCARSLPSILQLFVYLEVTPSIASLLQLERRRIKRAIFVGSVLLLLLESTWSALGLALVPFHGGGLREDPVALLLGQNGPVSSAVLALGCFAVLTTILGTNLALRSFCGDAKPRAALASYSFCVLAPALAPKGAFFAAIDFAGAYPVTLLWGCALPLMALARNKSRRQLVLLLFLLFVSLAMVTSFALQDLGLLSRAARWA